MNKIFLFSVLICSQLQSLQNKPLDKVEIKITSNAFKDGELIPSKYTCDGVNVSPDLKWNKPNDKIKSFALIVDDPDAPSGDFVHWIVYNIPDSIIEFPENVTSSKNIPEMFTIGKNDFGKIGYGGPCPPSGTHRYYFKIYGLDTVLHNAEAGLSKYKLLKVMEGHVVASGQLMGKYSRKR